PAEQEPPAPIQLPLERSVVRAVMLPDRMRQPVRLLDNSAIWIASEGELATAIAAHYRREGHRPRVASNAELLRIDVPSDLAGLVVLAPDGILSDEWLRDCLFVVKRTGRVLRERKGILITASRMDGAFGLAGTSWREPIDGGLAGLAKTVRQEWPTVHAKA